jgi:hypothetical protein
VIITFFVPTVGLGCRSLGYIIYGCTSVVIMFLTIISTIFARVSETREKESATVKSFTASIAIALRRICSLLALINGTGLILLSFFQLTNLFDSCYCNSNVIGRGTKAYITISYTGPVAMMMSSRIAGTVLSGVVMAIYIIFLRLILRSPEDLDDC